MNKQIYLIKTKGCSACRAMEYILERVIENKDCEYNSLYFDEIPEFISVNVPLNDFPTTVFVIDNVIKYHFVGTKSVKRIRDIMKDINF